MTEFFLPFLIGYATSRILSSMLSSSVQTARPNDSILLKWDNTVFGWRTVSSTSEYEKNQRYMIAKPVPSEFVSSVFKINKNSDG